MLNATSSGELQPDQNTPVVVLDELPAGILEMPATALYQLLPGPCLIKLSGIDPRPLVVSVLQHGNEDTGWEAIRQLLKNRYQQAPLPRSLWLWIGNTQAARWRRRRLPEQPDFNRCWPYPGRPPSSDRNRHEVTMFSHVFQMLQQANPLAVIDAHNNSGLNPHYSAINRLDWRSYNLARRFADIVVYFTSPPGTLANACADFCPSLTLECGQAGTIHGTDHAMRFIDDTLQLPVIDAEPRALGEGVVYHMMATVYVSPGLQFGFQPEQHVVSFVADLDHHNFHHLPAGIKLADIETDGAPCVLALDSNGHDITDEYFSFEHGELRTRREVIPSMLTLDERVINQDCLCYLMEVIDPFPEHADITTRT